MKQNTKRSFQSKGPLRVKKFKKKKGKEVKMAKSLVFSSFFWNQSVFTLCFEYDSNFLFYLQPLVWKERERGWGREKSAQQAANLVCKHYLWTLCAWVSWNYSAEKTWTLLHLFGLWDLTSFGSWNSRERKKKGEGGGQRRGEWEMEHILPWRWEVIPLSGKRFIFEGQMPSSYSGVKLA